jgi:two-component system nitrate/nitrite sensor histidine kinase NarX
LIQASKKYAANFPAKMLNEVCLINPKIQLDGDALASHLNEVSAEYVSEPVKQGRTSAAIISSQASVLLEGFLANIIRSLGASAGMVRVLLPNGKQFRMLGCSGIPDEALQRKTVLEAVSGAGDTSDADFCRNKYGEAFFGESCRHILAEPLGENDTSNQPEGVITLFFSTGQGVTNEASRTLKTCAELVRIALKSFWQNEEFHQNNLLAERMAIANEIHDSLAQTLYYAKIRASLLLEAIKTDNDILAFKCAQDIDETLEGSQKTVRELVTHFRSQMDSKGLKYAIHKLVKDFSARTSLVLEYENQVEDVILPLEYELQIFHILREALVNIATHSGASSVRLKANYSDGQYRFTVEDNGVGLGSGNPKEGHYGLAIMRERALSIGGHVEVENMDGLGTRVQLIFSAPVV